MGLLVLLFVELYDTQKKEYKQDLYKTMQVCSYTMKCESFDFDFADYNQSKLNKLYEDKGLYAYFNIPTSGEFMITFHYPQNLVLDDIAKIRNALGLRFVLASLLLMILAMFFTFYSLKPIRKALQLNDEFIKDILHDFNTPISVMVLNIEMFKEDFSHNPFVENISHSIDTISLLQNNLKSFLSRSSAQTQNIDVSKLLKKRVAFVQNLYPNIDFEVEAKNALWCQTHTQLLTRVLDNLLSNACKYNKPQGKVMVHVSKESIRIQDTGKGIQDIEKVFERYYTEQERGVGLGLAIVKKLTEELDIGLTLTSKLGVGTTVTLAMQKIVKAKR